MNDQSQSMSTNQEKKKNDNYIENLSDENYRKTQAEENLYEQYRVKKTIRGNEYYWKESETLAFKEAGKKKIVTESNSKVVAQSIVDVAESKGWENIKVSGDETFRRQIWKLANEKGIAVTGYKPTKQDIHEQQEGINKRDNKSVTNESAEEKKEDSKKNESIKTTRSSNDSVKDKNQSSNNNQKRDNEEKITEKDRQNYKNLMELKETDNVKLIARESNGQKSVTISVKDQEKTTRYTFKVDDKKMTAKPTVVSEPNGKETDRKVVTNEAADKGTIKNIEDGLRNTLDKQKQDARIADRYNSLSKVYKNESQTDAVKKHPELKELYKIERAAKSLANNRITDPESRKKYIDAIRERSLKELSRGEKLPTVNEKPVAQAKSLEQQAEM